MKSAKEITQINEAKNASSDINSSESYFNNYSSYTDLPESLAKDGEGIVK